MNPTIEQELDNDNVLMHKIDDILYGEHKQPYSRGDSLLMLIRNQIQAHINAEIAKVLDRLAHVAEPNHEEDPYHQYVRIKVAIQAERAKLKEVK